MFPSARPSPVEVSCSIRSSLERVRTATTDPIQLATSTQRLEDTILSSFHKRSSKPAYRYKSAVSTPVGASLPTTRSAPEIMRHSAPIALLKRTPILLMSSRGTLAGQHRLQRSLRSRRTQSRLSNGHSQISMRLCSRTRSRFAAIEAVVTSCDAASQMGPPKSRTGLAREPLATWLSSLRQESVALLPPSNPMRIKATSAIRPSLRRHGIHLALERPWSGSVSKRSATRSPLAPPSSQTIHAWLCWVREPMVRSTSACTIQPSKSWRSRHSYSR